jgi:hypothetical protein
MTEGEISNQAPDAAIGQCRHCGHREAEAGQPLALGVFDTTAQAWGVFDPVDGMVHAANSRTAAHEHITDSICEFGIPEASKWFVRPLFFGPNEPE